MVRTILFDKQANKNFQKLLDGKLSQSGLLIGQISASKDFILHVIPTPLNDTDNKQEDWIVNHALQIHDMLTGGLDLLGIYIVDIQESLNARTILNKIFKSLSDFQYYKQMNFNSERLIWVVDSKTKNIIMKTADVNDAKSSLQKCEIDIKDGLIDDFLTITSDFDLDSTFTMPNVYNHELLKTNFNKNISDEFLTNQERFLCLVNNEQNPDENAKFSDLYLKNITDKSEFKATLLENLSQAKEVKSETKQNLDSLYHITSASSSLVIFQKNCTIKQIKQLLIYDLVRSLFARMRLLTEDLDARQEIIGEENIEDPNSMEECYQTPKRIFINLNGKNLFISDYVFPDENEIDITERIKQLFNFEIKNPSSQIVQVENFPPEIRNAEFEADLEKEMLDEVTNETSSKKREEQTDVFKMVPAILVGLFAIFIAILLWILNSKN